jgi:glucose-1-phosphate cytidylyltransferase
MKVVLFCGGFGMRMREFSEAIPKPMVPIGYRPILWHVMKYYAHYGHKDFILCLGYQADVIKNYFLQYNECLSNDFVLSKGGKHLELLGRDIDDWNITFVDTGLESNIGQRFLAVKKHVENEEMFLANYTDAVSDLSLPDEIQFFKQTKKTACFLGVQPRASFHVASLDQAGVVQGMSHIAHSGNRINGGFFIFRNQIFDYIKAGEDLVSEPFQRMIHGQELVSYPYNGFWACMDTFKEKQQLGELSSRGKAPWEVWKA